MSDIEKALGRIKQTAFDVGMPTLAEKAGIPTSSARDLLKGHKAIKKLIALETAADALKTEAPAE